MNSSDTVLPGQPDSYDISKTITIVIVAVGMFVVALSMLSYKFDFRLFTQKINKELKKKKGPKVPKVSEPWRYHEISQYERRMSELQGWIALGGEDGCPAKLYSYFSLIVERELASPKRKNLSEEVVDLLKRIKHSRTGGQLKGIYKTIHEDKTLVLNAAVNPMIGEAYWYSQGCVLAECKDYYHIDIDQQAPYEEV